MNITESLERLADHGEARGADAVFEAATRRLHQLDDQSVLRLRAVDARRTSRPQALAAVAAVIAVALIGAGVVLLSPGGEDVAGVAATEPPATDGPVKGGPPVLATAYIPDGYALVSGALIDAGTTWPGPPGSLDVFQRSAPDGDTLVAVIAISVSEPGERTSLDTIPVDPAALEVSAPDEITLGDRVVSRAHASGGTYGEFDVARWLEPTGETVTVATRGLDDEGIRQVIAAVDVANHEPVVDTAVLPNEVQRIEADPVLVPEQASFGQTTVTYGNSAGDRVTVGASTGSEQSAAAQLWWVSGARLAGQGGEVLLADRFAYRATRDGAVSISSTNPLSAAVVDAIADSAVVVSGNEWRRSIGDADETSEVVAGTTTTTTTLGGG